MLIVADENIPLLDEFFGDLGEVRRYPGRTLQSGQVQGADMLLVRSVSRIDAGLLGTTRPSFIGSATIGTDHVDLQWLAANGIPFAAAPGCNARAVAEYVVTALAGFADESGRPLAGLRLGIVGCGHVGSQVLGLAGALGLQVAACDPLLPPGSRPAGAVFMMLDELLAWADVVSLHVPLTRAGPASTWHLLDAGRLHRGRWELLINTSRGAVVDNAALADCLRHGGVRRALLDVWEQEPRVPAGLLAACWRGTPHIAGYSNEGKWRGTAMLATAARRALGLSPGRSLDAVLDACGDKPATVAWPGSLSVLLDNCCPLSRDDAALRGAVTGGEVTAAAFDRLRRDYPGRREFMHYRVSGVPGAETATPQGTAALLAELGFRLV